jgi:hypothetical protein
MASPVTMSSIIVPPVLERRAVTVKNRVQCKQDQIVTWLQEFYSEKETVEKLLPILQGKSPISLRLVDYFVTNYAKKTNTSYMLNDKHFLVYFNYKRELNAYSKRLFDPFCRRERIMFESRGIEPFVTTVGQLNFFRWFLEKGIYDFMLTNREAIEKDMNVTLKNHYSRSNSTITDSVGSTGSQTQSTETIASSETIDSNTTPPKSRKKRCELTQSAMKKVNIHECEVVVNFC